MTAVELRMLEFFEGKGTIDLNELFKGLKYEYDEAVLTRAHWVLNGKGFIKSESEGSIRYSITEKGTDKLNVISSNAEQSRREKEEENASQKELKRLQIDELKYKETIRGLEIELRETQIKGIKVQKMYYWYMMLATLVSAFVTYMVTVSGYIDGLAHILAKLLSMFQ
jgi:hypothetical protein